MKFEQRPEIGLWLGEQLAEQWLAQSALSKSLANCQVVPIPLHRAKQQQRGYNQSEKIAAGFCRWTGYPLYPQALQRIKNTQALFSLSPGDRQRELQSVFQVGKQFNRKYPWLIVDDIVTTGSTAQEAKQAIEQQGGRVIGLVAIAAPSRNPSRQYSDLLK
jgi:ComF family protein